DRRISMPGNQDVRTQKMRLLELEAEHRELDQLIASLDQGPVVDELAMRRLKKRKLQIKDQIAALVGELTPSEPA
ncbi:MAG: YdcH family protein, partial [Burkholderiaceae bacterium]